MVLNMHDARERRQTKGEMPLVQPYSNESGEIRAGATKTVRVSQTKESRDIGKASGDGCHCISGVKGERRVERERERGKRG